MSNQTLKCPKCKADNPSAYKFCGICGTILKANCSKCSVENPAVYEYCGNCGALLHFVKTETHAARPITSTKPPDLNQKPRQSNGCSCGCFATLVLITVVLGLIWFAVRPGVFSIQPIGALPDGVTFIYHSRNPEVPFFSSPDGLCLKTQNSITLLCRAAAISAASNLTDRILIKLPYNRWAYLQSTGGLEFDR